jgi:DNA-binding MarR family transcriptional regulator
MGGARKTTSAVIDDITGRLMRRHTTAAVLFHHAIAERLDLGPTDLKCLDVLRERGRLTGSQLAAITGLTSGAITGIVARLEDAGYLQREPDPADGRKQILSAALDRVSGVHAVFTSMHAELAAELRDLDTRQLAAIAEFLERSTELIHRQIGHLRSQRLAEVSASPSAARARVKTRR